MTRAVVVGGCGFIGSHVCEKLTARGVDVVSVHRSTESGCQRDWKCLIADYRDVSTMSQYLVGADILVHLGSQSVPRTSMELGVTGILNEVNANAELFQAAASRDVQKVVYASSGGSVYGECEWGTPITESHPLNPISPHGLLKVMTEQILAHIALWSGQEVVSLRPGNVYGPGQASKRLFGVVPTFIANLQRGTSSEVWGAEVVRDYVYVTDTAEAFVLAALSSSRLSQTYNIGTGVGHTALELYSILQDQLDVAVPVNIAPRPATDPKWNVLSTSLMSRELGYTPSVDIRTGLRLACDPQSEHC